MRRWQMIILVLALVLVTAIGAFSDWWNGWRVSDELPPELDNGSIYAERLFTGETVSFSGGNFTPEAYTYLDNVGRGIKLVIEIFTNNSWMATDRFRYRSRVYPRWELRLRSMKTWACPTISLMIWMREEEYLSL